MELTYATIIVLASMIFMLAGMVGYLYWQQTGILRHLQGLANLIAAKLTPPTQVTFIQTEAEEESEEDDDRVSVKEEVEKVEGPVTTEEEVVVKEEVDVDDLQDKTAAQLRDMLTAKGIPFGKRDAKTVLIQLLKATS